MTYSELINKINSDKSGIAKGYDISFLQNECVSYSDGDKKFDNILVGDLQLFTTIQENMANINEPKDGDFVEYEKGKYSRISTDRHDGTFQISNNIGIFVSADGSSSASGCTWDSDFDYIESDRLTLDNLKPTTKTMKGECWTFSGNYAGGGRGVRFDINFKVWLLG